MGAPRADASPAPSADAAGTPPEAARRGDGGPPPRPPEAPAGPEFDGIAALAADLLRAPSALVSLVDEDGRRTLLGRAGIEAMEAPSVWPFCDHAAATGGDLLVVPDAAADPRFAGAPRVRFYAGAPMTAPDGAALGTVSVFSPDPRPFGVSPAERRRLAALAALAARAMESRRAAREAAGEAQALRAAEERLRSAFVAAGGCAWDLRPPAGLSAWDAAARHLFGMPDRPLPFAEALAFLAHPDDADAVRDAVARATGPAGEGRFAVEHRGPRPDSAGRPRWFRSVGEARPAADGGGGEVPPGPPRLACATIEVTEQRAVGERQALIVAELNHRVKNTLTVVLALAEQSFRARPGGGGPEMGRFHADFQARVLALSRAHDLLTREAWKETDLAELARAALAPFGVLGAEGAPARIEARGPRALLAPGPAASLAMALHELATNATKYGALSRPAGTVSLVWGPAPDGAAAALDIAWTESGGPPLSGPPARRGFGLHLLERSLARQLGGEVSLDYGAAGLSCRLRVPLGGRVALG